MQVVVVRAGALGDLLLLRPALQALRRAGHRVTLLAPERPAAVFQSADGREVEALLAWERPELSSLLNGETAPSPLRDRLSAAGRIVAYTRSLDLLRALEATGAPVSAHDPSPPEGRHAADWLSDAVRELAPGPTGVPPSMRPTADERLAADPLLRRLGAGFLAVHPGSGSVAKSWAPDSFRRAIDGLSPNAPFLLVRGAADDVACAELEKDPRAVLADRLPLRVLGAVLAGAGVFAGNDSGVSHLAAAFGAPTLVLFGPTEAATWRPVGCCVRTISSSSRAMAGLKVEDVVAAARQLAAPRESRDATSAARALPSG